MTEPGMMEGGYSAPVFESQAVFRGVMDAMARPGHLVGDLPMPRPPAPLLPSAAAVALTPEAHVVHTLTDPHRERRQPLDELQVGPRRIEVTVQGHHHAHVVPPRGQGPRQGVDHVAEAAGLGQPGQFGADHHHVHGFFPSLRSAAATSSGRTASGLAAATCIATCLPTCSSMWS